MTDQHEIISKYLHQYINDIDELYSWNFDDDIPFERFNFKPTSQNLFQKTKELKEFLSELIYKNPDDLVLQNKIASYFIKDWGGIRGFKNEKKVVHRFKNIIGTETVQPEYLLEFESISSWSKWVALICPQWACIYDTRVIYSLNAINFIKKGNFQIFPSPTGRNTRLNLLDISTLLLCERIKYEESIEPKIIQKKYFIPKAEVYTTYLNLLNDISISLWGDSEHIFEVEILLFSLSDKQIYKDVIDSIT